ncbi:unnamed protein product [Rotaria socialis]|uniref:Uncharacterized protein n=1 Tax=Rotaria socialis TaxID=392032 RepID=A0A817SQD6_9BILA|nr:unnamed protein product [Rotaria socialis]CAF3423297.1 unnamed protein product [Rotaria socialis]CAF3443433.1 unnamed protein product [Rotaria socialis]CAF3730391.1 unnamed protein product [Rotaria socialis]
MSNKDPRSVRYKNSKDVIEAGKRDVELTFLKKVSMGYQGLNSPSGSDQGGKRGRTSSDDDLNVRLLETIPQNDRDLFKEIQRHLQILHLMRQL